MYNGRRPGFGGPGFGRPVPGGNRFFGGGFLAPFILGGITGGLLSPPRPYPVPAPYPVPYPPYPPYPIIY